MCRLWGNLADLDGAFEANRIVPFYINPLSAMNWNAAMVLLIWNLIAASI
jgi:hypothetical protein